MGRSNKFIESGFFPVFFLQGYESPTRAACSAAPTDSCSPGTAPQVASPPARAMRRSRVPLAPCIAGCACSHAHHVTIQQYAQYKFLGSAAPTRVHICLCRYIAPGQTAAKHSALHELQRVPLRPRPGPRCANCVSAGRPCGLLSASQLSARPVTASATAAQAEERQNICYTKRFSEQFQEQEEEQ